MRYLLRKGTNTTCLTAVTRNREHRKVGGVAILLRQYLAFTEIIQHTMTTDNEQLTVTIWTDSNRELYVSTVYCPHGNPSIELIDGLCENSDQVVLTVDFNCKHPELGNDQTNSSGTRLTIVAPNNNLILFSSRNQPSLIAGTFGWKMITAKITLS